MNQQPASPGPAEKTMSVVTVFDPSRMVRTHRVAGNVNLPAFCSILQGLYASKQFNPDLNALWDLRMADFSGIMPENVRELMHVVMNHWGHTGKCRSAILVASMTEFGMARTYASQFGRTAPCEISVFLDLKEARDWLGIGQEPGESVPAPAANQVDAKANG